MPSNFIEVHFWVHRVVWFRWFLNGFYLPGSSVMPMKMGHCTKKKLKSIPNWLIYNSFEKIFRSHTIMGFIQVLGELNVNYLTILTAFKHSKILAIIFFYFKCSFKRWQPRQVNNNNNIMICWPWYCFEVMDKKFN